ncbi:RNA polymerase sigma factor [Flavihumibacter fluvii]|uniref:RNA polymerase sigma factor n=1 Tax=Flavihumibacter fluvii TaxID=2838157 RepID=UPI001BDEF86E|nr:sigma-70 family RNA polymerase sigma factor [Flavihumibacter fluvii]ULQ52162.1 sigma-70 family RNA polymerase sigma factor [Flavihumibacter fluvii]
MHFTPENISAEQLLFDFRQGDDNALKIIFNLHYHALLSFANRLIKDDIIADDIIMISFMKLWNKRSVIESIPGLIAYLYTIVRNEAKKHLANAARIEKLQEEANYLSRIEESIDAFEIKAKLFQLILMEAEALPAQMKRVFKMAYIDEMVAPAIADKLHLSVHTVQDQKKKAKQKIRAALAKKGWEKWSFMLLAYCYISVFQNMDSWGSILACSGNVG